MSRRWRSILGFWVVLLVMDAAAAQFTDVMLDRLLPPDAEEYRMFSPIYHHDLRPDVDVTGVFGPLRYSMRTNALGFRSDSVGSVPLARTEPRLLFISDSFTEGVGVAYEQTFVGRLAAAYREQGIEVLNAGVASYAPTIYHRKIKHLIEEVGLQFDTLAVFIDLSDVDNEVHEYRVDAQGNVIAANAPRPWRPWRRGRDWLVRNSIIFRFGRGRKKAIQARSGQLGESTAANCYPRPLQWEVEDRPYREFGQEGLRRAAEAMGRLDALARQHGFGLIVAVYPWPHSIAGGHVDSRHVRFWREWSEERGLPFLDLFPAFMTGEARDDVIRRHFIRCDMHWNAEGHARVADFFLARYPDAEALSGAARASPQD